MNNCPVTEACIGRREFLVKAGLAVGGVVLTVSTVTAGGKPEDVSIAIAPDGPLAKAGGSQIVDSTAGKLIVVCTEAGKFVAFSARCTHKRAILSYDHEQKLLVCPSHGSKFSGSDGSVAKGPAETKLASYPATGSVSSVTVTVP